MNINEIATKMTREEFINNIKRNVGSFKYENFIIGCPDSLGLQRFSNCCGYGDSNCRECWEKAIKNIKFKGDEKVTSIPEEIEHELEESLERVAEMVETPTKIEKHTYICNKLNNLYEAKNHDYGDSFGDTFKKLGIISAITRITDKVNRLQSLTTKDAAVDESIKDTLMDLANYSIMTLIELDEDV